jgi:DNA mismatch repair protein MutL
MGKIIVLDESTSNKIAAGEVIERPASVVKELVENSIDAGATSISVDIKNGGISYIKVVDNGAGIDEDDAEIAFERHSTSKIMSASDLEGISTLGFRGEALASIAAVSRIRMTTRTKDKQYGLLVEVCSGRVTDVRQTGCPVGTTFTVTDLFFNTPARYKFLKKDSTEAGYISDIICRLALGNPHISFRLESESGIIVRTPGNNDLLSTIFSIYGRDIARGAIETDYSENGIRIGGYVGKPEIARANRNHQSFFINGRYIKSKTIASAVEEAYKTLLMKNKYPFAVLKLDIRLEQVDVNVHPGKMEVRFSNGQDVFRAVFHAVNNALMKQAGLVSAGYKSKSPFLLSGNESSYEKQENMEPEQYALINSPGLKTSEKEVEYNISEAAENAGRLNEADEYDRKCADSEGRPAGKSKTVPDSARIIGQVFSTYILLQHDEKLIILDQHAAHERILYEKLKVKFQTREPLSQMLISPLSVQLTHKEIGFLEEEKGFFNNLGFIYDNFGNNSVILRAVPFVFNGGDLISFFKDVTDRVMSAGKMNYELISDDVLYSIACKSAVKANNKLGEPEIRNMLSELANMENPFTCPHGRPIIAEITKTELEKMFGRIV